MSAETDVLLFVDLDLGKGTAARWRKSALPDLDGGVKMRNVPDADLDGDLFDLPETSVDALLKRLKALTKAGDVLVDASLRDEDARFELRGIVSPDALSSLLAALVRALSAAARLGARGEGACLAGGDTMSYHLEVDPERVRVFGLDPDGDAKRWKRIEKRWPAAVVEALVARRAASPAGPTAGPAAVPKGVCWLVAQGTVALAAPGEEARGFRDGLAAARGPKSPLWGYLDLSGAWRIAPAYDKAFDFSEGLALVQRGTLFGHVDASGAEVIPVSHGHAGHMSGGRAIVPRGGDHYGFVDRTNTPIEGRWPSVEPFSDGRAAVWLGKGYGFCDLDGAVVIRGPFTHVTPFAGGRAVVRDEKLGWLVIDRDGAVVVAPKQDVTLWRVGDGIAIQEGGNFGILDPDGAVVAPMELDEIGLLRDGTATGRRGASHWWYFRTGAPPLGPFFFVAPFGGGRAIVKDLKGAWAIVDPTGARLAELPRSLESAGRIEDNGVAWIKERNRYGFIDRSGAAVFPPRFQAIEDWDRPIILARA